MKLSVLIPVYNERLWIERVVKKVLAQRVSGIEQMELIIVDDGSTDGTREIIRDLAEKFSEQIKIVLHTQNAGKGAAIQSAVNAMTGDVCIIQDADLEYDPAEYPLMLEPIVQGRADCVYGSRFVGTQAKRVLYFWHYVANQGITLISNMFTNLNLSDIETGYKAFRSSILKTMPIRSKGFSLEPEITMKIAQRKCRVYEVGISYQGRTYQEGKKITPVDGLRAIFTILKFCFWNDSILK